MCENISLDIKVTSSVNVFPESTQGVPTTTPLSIIDCTVSYFARCAGIWYFDPPSSSETALSVAHLHISLSKILSFYPQLCGRLSYAVPQPNRGHSNRYRRVQLTYNAPTDIGVPFITATSSKTLSDFMPSTLARKASLKAWDASKMPSVELFPATPLALSSDESPPDSPNAIIQITTFACGSVAVGIEITHSLADAQSLSQFAKDWASVSRSVLANEALPTLSPVFDPQLLDFAAAGDIDAETPDPALQEQARNLPCHRFDWFEAVPNQPWPLRIPHDFNAATNLSPSTPIPWEDWDVHAPVSHRVLHFSPSELQHIYSQANSEHEFKISKHDALLAHIWTRINEARQIPSQTTTYLNVTFGLRPRLSPPLPDTFLGSPILIAAIPSHTPSSVSEKSSLARIALKIRTTLQIFTPSAIAAYLHDAAFEYCPQRLWQAFMGRKHILLTTWIHLGVHDVDFVGKRKRGPRLRYVEPVMPSCDGLVEIMEAVGDSLGHWTANGVDVSVFLERDSMGRLLEDRSLWGGSNSAVEN